MAEELAGESTVVGARDEPPEAAAGLRPLLVAGGRDFLVRNSGDQVKTSDIDGKLVGLYFSASWCGPCQQFTPKLVDTYNEILLTGGSFEIVFVSADEDADSFTAYFSKMPWLAIPFSDSDTRDDLSELFDVNEIPNLVIVDKDGKVLSSEGVQVVRDYGSEGYPYTPERIKNMREEEEAAKQNQTLRSLLVSSARDFLISKDGNKVPVSNIEGKIVGIYFEISSFHSCREFTRLLLDMYKKLQEKGVNFEVVLVSLDDEELSFQQGFTEMPWLAIPFKEKMCEKLVRYFELQTIPTLVIIGSDGKTLNLNASRLVEDYGMEAYPFSPEKIQELAEKEKQRLESQTLESLLVSGERDYVIGKGGVKVAVSELVGKNILIYFSAHWCPPCRAFLPKLIEAYHKIKEKNSAFEVIFVSSDQDENSFADFFSEMPWLALPFGDDRKKFLSRIFKIQGIPSLVAISPEGKLITKDAREMIMVYGAAAYPFTDERIRELELEMEMVAKGWPDVLKHKLHREHDLMKTRPQSYLCDQCEEVGTGWSFNCSQCDFTLHPECAVNVNEDSYDEVEGEPQDGGLEEEQKREQGYVCDGNISHRERLRS